MDKGKKTSLWDRPNPSGVLTYYECCWVIFACQILFELTVFATATIVKCLRHLPFFSITLATNTQAHPRHGLATRFRYGFFAYFTMFCAFAFRQSAPCQFNGFRHAGVDLFLFTPVSGPAYSHSFSLKWNFVNVLAENIIWDLRQGVQLKSLSQKHTTGGLDALTGDPMRFLGSQEGHDLSDIIHLPYPAQSGLGGDKGI
jgi:hypothetical protein